MAAAVHAVTARKKRREKLEAKARAQDQQFYKWLVDHDKSKNGRFDTAEARELFYEVKVLVTKGRRLSFVKEDRLEKLMQRYAADDGELGRDEVFRAVKRFKAMLKADDALRDMFRRHDLDGDGVLTSDECLALLKEASSDIDGVRVSKADVEFVMSRCEDTGAGGLVLDQLEGVLDTWKQAIKEVSKDATSSKSSSACVLL